ncbi:MAG: transcriptional regulator, TetR family [Frankiales bacterium]|jgi:AcrR family transcriptional regulator|nr:transcriptional regulator, TetR family [Frankiales bacterium]
MPGEAPREGVRLMTVEYDAKRRAILEGAAEVFVRHGFAAGTTKEIAAEVGLSQPAIYHYVGSKADLLREIALHVDQDMMAALDAGLARSDDPLDQLRGVIHEFTAAVVRDRRVFAVFWQELHSLAPETREKVSKDEREFVARVGRLITALQKQGRMPAGPPVVLAQAVLSMPSWMYHWYRPGGALTAAQIADTYCRLLGLEDEA